METSWEEALKELKKAAEEASEEDKSRGKQMASDWAFRRLGTKQKKELTCLK